MTIKVTYVEDTRPVTHLTLVQPKGTLDVTANINKNGKRIRLSNSDGGVVNIAVSELAEFKKLLDQLAKRGVKHSQKKAA